MKEKMDNIFSDGFSLERKIQGAYADRVTSYAPLSLGVALQAYFSTYQSMGRVLHWAFSESHSYSPEFRKEWLDNGATEYNFHSVEHVKLCLKTIVHFQHFVELVCKDFLFSRHQLLVTDAFKKPILLDKLLLNEAVTPEEMLDLRTVEFSSALERVCKLIKGGRLGNGDISFVLEAKPWLEQLNRLRNRMLHRGTFVLRYPALDKLAGHLLLPFAQRLLSLKGYSGTEMYWKYETLSCDLDPLYEIVKHFQNEPYNMGKIALLKELGRAAYVNPLTDFACDDWHNPNADIIAKAKAQAELDNDPGSIYKRILKCPVCGVPSLVAYDIYSEETDDFETGHTEAPQVYTYKMNCTCCSFAPDRAIIKNPSEYNLAMPDLWKDEQLS